MTIPTHAFSLAGSMTPYLLTEVSFDLDGHAKVKGIVDGELHSVKCRALRLAMEDHGIHYVDSHIIQMRPIIVEGIEPEEMAPRVHIQILDFSHKRRNRNYGFSIDVESTALMSLLTMAYTSKNIDPGLLGPNKEELN